MPESGSTPERRTAEAMELLEIIEPAIARGKVLPVKSAEFLNATRARFKQYKERTLISARELFWLRDIKDRCL